MRWKVGDLTIHRVVELESASIGRFVLPQATPEVVRSIPWLGSEFLAEDGRLLLSIHSFVVEAPGARILVDTCIGNDKERSYPAWNRMTSPFLERLAGAGTPREAVDLVVCTHLHVDHVGWNTMLVDGEWVATFPNARYLFGREEWEHWRDRVQEFGPVIEDSVRPIVDADLADLVDSDHRVSDEIRLEPTPGHTPGHVAVHLSSRGEEAVITGDLVHHPCQLAHPEWEAAPDTDAEQGCVTRRDFFARYADRPVLVLGSHFAGPTAGRIVRDGDIYRLDY